MRAVDLINEEIRELSELHDEAQRLQKEHSEDFGLRLLVIQGNVRLRFLNIELKEAKGDDHE